MMDLLLGWAALGCVLATVGAVLVLKAAHRRIDQLKRDLDLTWGEKCRIDGELEAIMKEKATYLRDWKCDNCKTTFGVNGYQPPHCPSCGVGKTTQVFDLKEANMEKVTKDLPAEVTWYECGRTSCRLRFSIVGPRREGEVWELCCPKCGVKQYESGMRRRPDPDDPAKAKTPAAQNFFPNGERYALETKSRTLTLLFSELSVQYEHDGKPIPHEIYSDYDFNDIDHRNQSERLIRELVADANRGWRMRDDGRDLVGHDDEETAPGAEEANSQLDKCVSWLHGFGHGLSITLEQRNMLNATLTTLRDELEKIR